MGASRIRSIVSLVVVALVLGVFTLSPVAAHFTTNTKHLGKHAWQQFIKNKVYTKNQANNRFLPGGNLPQGATIRGSIIIADTASGANSASTADIMFGFTLASRPTAHFIPAGGAPPAACPGSVANPQARPGHLCVYERLRINTGVPFLYDPLTNDFDAASRFGAALVAFSSGAGLMEVDGSWAVTAPGAGSASATNVESPASSDAGLEGR